MDIEVKDEKQQFNGSSSEDFTAATLSVAPEWDPGLERKARRK